MDQNEIRAMADRKKPQVKLAGEDGNAFSILGRTRTAMKKADWTQAEITEFTNKAMDGDYDELLATVVNCCEVE